MGRLTGSESREEALAAAKLTAGSPALDAGVSVEGIEENLTDLYGNAVYGDETPNAGVYNGAGIGDDRLLIDVRASEGGAASGGGLVQPGDEVTLSAVAEEGYRFSGWYREGILLSTENPYTFQADEAAVITAAFERIPGTITHTIVEAEDCTLSPPLGSDPGVGFARDNDAASHAGGHIRTSMAGATLTLPFNGRAVRFFTKKGPGAGKVQVTLDGEDLGAIDLYNGSATFQQEVFAKTDLADGEHTLVLTTLPASEANPSASGTIMCNFDYFDVTHFEPEELSEHMLTVNFPKNVKLSVNNEEQKLANLLGVYKAAVMGGENVELHFAPALPGREIAGVTVDGEAVEIDEKFDGNAYVFCTEMPNEETTIDLGFTVVDKQILRVTIDIAEDCADEAAAAAGSVQKKYEAALKAAKAVEKDKTATQDEINDAWSELLDALHYLSFVAGDKTKLETPLNIAEQVDRDRFTPKSVEALDAAVAVAKDLMDDEEVLEADVKAAVDALYDALDNLVARADMSNLAEAVAYGESLDQSKYIDDDALETFNQVLGEAQELLEDANATQEAVNAKAQELLDAIEELRITPNKDTLKELIAKGEKTDTKDVPASVAKKLADAMDRARVVLADEKSSEADVEEAVNSLQAALKAVEEAKNNQKPDNNSTGKKRSKSTRNISNTYGAAGIVSAAQKVSASIHCDAAGVITLKRGQSYTLKVTVTNGSGAVPSFTVGNGSVLKTQFVSQYGNEYYFKVYATGAPGQSTGAYAALNGKGVEKLCEVKVVA